MSILKKQKLFIYDHVNSRELSESYLSEPKNTGQFFILLELAKEKTDYQNIIDQITSELSLYFENSQNDDPESLLEEILQLLNQLLPTLAPQKNRLWFQKINLVVGILHSNSVYLAGIGNIDAWLLNHNQFTQILDKTTDINPAKIFTDITSGSLDSGDVLVISTNALFDYVSKEKIRLLTQKYSPQAAVDQLYKLLETVPDFVSFNSLFIKNPSSNEIDLKNPIADEELAPKIAPSIAPNATQAPRQDAGLKNVTKAQTPNKKAHAPKTKLVFDKRGLQNIKLVRQVLWLWSLITTFFGIVAQICQTIFAYLKKTYLFLFSHKFRRQSEDTHTQRQVAAELRHVVHRRELDRNQRSIRGRNVQIQRLAEPVEVDVDRAGKVQSRDARQSHRAARSAQRELGPARAADIHHQTQRSRFDPLWGNTGALGERLKPARC